MRETRTLLETLKRPARVIDGWLGGRLRRGYRRLVPAPSPFANIRGRRPEMLSVEPTSRCNLNCPFCLVGMQNSLPSTEHDLLPRGMGTMDMELYRKIVADASAFGIRRMQLHFQGEPLLHTKIHEMVRLARDRGMATNLFTNGLPLTPAMADRLLDAGLDSLRFSVDGTSEEVYRQNRVGGEFWRVHRNMKMMAEKVRARGARTALVWQMIALRNNEAEIETGRRMAAELGIDYFVKSFAVTDPALAPRDPAWRRALHIKPCFDVYRSIFVYWNGDVVPCCYDQEGKEIVGNLGRQTLVEVWESERYRTLRRQIDEAFLHPDREPELCRSCLKWGHEPHRTSDGKIVWEDADGAAPAAAPVDDDV